MLLAIKILVSSFLILAQSHGCDIKELQKSDRYFFQEGTDWECKKYCPLMTGCEKECCPKEKDNAKGREEDGQENKENVKRDRDSTKKPGNNETFQRSGALIVVLTLFICLLTAIAAVATYKYSNIFRRSSSADVEAGVAEERGPCLLQHGQGQSLETDDGADDTLQGIQGRSSQGGADQPGAPEEIAVNQQSASELEDDVRSLPGEFIAQPSDDDEKSSSKAQEKIP